MTLAEIRLKFIEVSGRYDLVVDGDISSNVDNGANFYIQAAQRWLDRSVDVDVLSDIREISILADNYVVEVPNLLSINLVMIDGVEIAKRTKEWIMINYPGYATTSSSPSYWAFATRSRTSRGNKRIMFNCPVSVDTTIVVNGSFGDSLTVNGDESFWSTEFPELLVYASMFQIEAFYRNSEGMRDWLNVINVELDAVDFEFNLEQFEPIMQMSEQM